MNLYEFWTRCLLHSRCYWGKEETIEGKQTLNVKFRNGSVGNCMLKIPTSRTFFCTKTFINCSRVAFWCFLKVGFATRLFIRTAYLLVNQKKAGSTHFHPVFVCPCRCLEAGLPHLKKDLRGVFRLFKRVKSLHSIILSLMSSIPGVTNGFVVLLLVSRCRRTITSFRSGRGNISETVKWVDVQRISSLKEHVVMSSYVELMYKNA